MITISIDVLLLEKARFKKVTKRNGQGATYCDLVLFETPNGEYGDYIVKQGVTKEERAARKEMPILGNGRIIYPNKGGGSSIKHTAPAENDSEPTASDDVNF